MTRSLSDFENNIRPVKINGKMETYDVTISPNTSDDPLIVIDNIISDFEGLASVAAESVSEAASLIQRNDKLYTFQVMKNMYPLIESNELKLHSSSVLFFNYHKVLFVLSSNKSKLSVVMHNNKKVFDATVSLRDEYAENQYKSKLFRLIELIEDIFNTTIDQLSNGLIAP